MTFVSMVLIFVVICTALQLYYWLFRFRLPASASTEEPAPGSFGVSIVICAHNEYENLAKNLPQVLGQEYPNFEVIVVDHGSTDKTKELVATLQSRWHNLILVYCPMKAIGKKHALSAGIEQTKHEWILLTDADCAPSSKHWIKYMVAPFSNSVEIVLGAAPFVAGDAIVNKFARFDSAITYLQYTSAAIQGSSFMGVGRNMAYLRTVYQEQKDQWRDKYIGGDDDLFVSQYRRRNIFLVVQKEAMMYSDAPREWRQFFRQKRRHVSVSWAYATYHKIELFVFAGSHWGHLCGIFALILMGEALWLSVALFTLRSWAMVATSRRYARYFILGMSTLWLLIADLFYVFQYPLITLFLILKPPKKW